MLFQCMGICVLSPAHESEMRGYLVYVLIVKYLSHRFCLNSATVYQIERPYLGIFEGFFETFLEGYVDRVIYRDYIVNRRFFNYRKLACGQAEDGNSEQAVQWGQVKERKKNALWGRQLTRTVGYGKSARLQRFQTGSWAVLLVPSIRQRVADSDTGLQGLFYTA